MLNPSPTFRTLDPTTDEHWDEQIARFPGATVFHTSAWARVLREAYGFRPCYLALSQSGSLQSVLTWMEVDSWITGRRGLALPFTDVCRVLMEGSESEPALWRAALQQGRDRGWRWMELRDSPNWLHPETPSTSYYHHTLDLSAGERALFEGLQPATRRGIRKAQQSGLTVGIADTRAATAEFYRLLELTRRRHGLPPQPRRFFAAIQKHLLAAGHGEVVLVRRGPTTIAGAVFLRYRTHVVYKFGASDERYQHLRGNNLVMWEAIRHFVQQGAQTLDFGRTSLDHDGLRRFKQGWGATENVLHYHRFDLRTDQYVTVPDRASGWHSTIFRRLPRPLSRLAGEILYRHIA